MAVKTNLSRTRIYGTLISIARTEMSDGWVYFSAAAFVGQDMISHGGQNLTEVLERMMGALAWRQSAVVAPF